jgi:UDP-N-acetylmuramoyl-tripeptide--D-alanyl-D-alanine ligase
MEGGGMMRLSELAPVLDARLSGAEVEFAAVATDSRKIAAGDLFVALRGDHFDGAAFVAKAAQDGAVAAVVNADSELADAPIPVLYVADTRLALGRLAAYWRSKFDLPLIAVTGSNGKTTVKEMLASILRVAGGENSVLATQGNLNNDIGMPLTLLRLREEHRYAVIEMGMNHVGEIDYLTRLARPTVALVNNASGAHLAGLGSVEAVARAKGEIFAGLGDDGVAVINADDAYAPLWRELAAPHRVMDFSLDGETSVSCCWDVSDFGTKVELIVPGAEATVLLQVPGAHNVRNALAATAAALAVGIPLAQIAAGLESFTGVGGRLQRQTTPVGAVVIDDTYNANPASMKAALQVLAQQQGLRVVVMGDMGELGADAARFHAEIGAAAARDGIQRMYALGPLSAHAAQAFGAGAQHFTVIDDLLNALDRVLGAGVTVLVKGSRFMKMERVVSHCVSGEKTCCSH